MKTDQVRSGLQQGACLGTLLCIGTIAMAADRSAPITSLITSSTPAVPVASVFKPAAFVMCAAEGDGAIEKCGALGGVQTYTVPGNRPLLIEQITGVCSGGSADNLPPLPQRIAINVVTGGSTVDHVLFGQHVNGGFEGFSDDTRLYADAGSTISVDLTGINATTGRFCRLAFSGQFILK